MSQFFLDGIQAGFQIGVVGVGSNFKSARKNMRSTLEHAHVMQEYLSAEILEHRVAGPFRKKPNPFSSC